MSFFTKIRPYLWLIGIIILIFSKTLTYDFTRLDDAYYLLDNQSYFANLSNIAQTFTQSIVAEQYRPILFSSFITDTQIHTSGTWMYHTTNIIFHIAASCLVFTTLIRLQNNHGVALVLTTLFAIHPLATQTVAWIPGRSESMLTVFVLLGFLSFLKFQQTASTQHYCWHLAWFTLGLLTKETAILLPAFCGLYLLLVLKQRPFSRQSLILLAGWTVVAGTWFIARTLALTATTNEMTSVGQASALNLIGMKAFWLNIRTIPELCGKMLFPVAPSVYPQFSIFATVLGFVALGCLFAALFIARKGWQNVVFGLVWLIFCLLPPMVIRATGDRFDYLDYRGYLALVGFLFVTAECARQFILKKHEQKALYVAYAVIACFAAITWFHTPNFNGEEAFWSKAMQEHPSLAESYLHIGTIRLAQDKPAEAEALLRNGIQRDSTLALAYSKLANAIYTQRPATTFDETVQLFRQARTLNKKLTDPHINLIIIHIQRQQYAEALQYAADMQRAGLDLETLRPDVAGVLRSIRQQEK